MEDKRNIEGAGSQTSDPRPVPERTAAQVDVLAANELRLSSSFLSRRLDARTEGALRGRPIESKS